MRNLIRRTLGLVLALAIIAGFALVPFPAKVEATGSSNAQANIQDGVTLHCWNWSFANIEANLDKIAAAGYTAVQTSPVQPLKEATNATWSTYQGQWWLMYQPVEFKINTNTNNALGTKAELKSLCEAAEKKGIKVIVDVVANHLADNGGNNISNSVPSYLKNNSAYWHDISKNTNDYNNRYEITQYCMAGLPDLNTGNKEIQNYVLNFLKECVDVGVDGFRFDAAKHIEVPEDSYCGSDFWPTVINGIKAHKPDVYLYGEILDATGGTALTNYTKYMSVTDNRWSDKVRENVICSGNAGNYYSGYDSGASADKLVLWAESHDTYANDNGASKYDSVQNINKTWALVAARANAMSLYLARPDSLSNKLGSASANTGWNWTEIAAVNKFHNHFVGQSEYISNSNGYAMVERGTTGAVIVNVSTDGNVNIPVNKMANGKYVDQISGNTFTVSNGRITGKISHQCGYAVIYNACDHNWSAGTTTDATCTKDGSVKYTCSKCGDSKTDVIPAKGHTFVNDKCTVCGAAKPADHVLYFSNNGQWSKVNVYYWSDSDTKMVTWPGNAMTSIGDGIYSYTVPADATYVIFNNGQDGDSNKTADLTISSAYNYYCNGKWTTYATCSHNYTAKVTTAATCDKAGVKTYTCDSCGDSYTESIPALGHKYVSGTCTNCGAKEPCTSHSWDNGTVTTAATCTKTGVKTYTCSNCGNTKTETIAALGHKFVGGKCSACGVSESKDTMTIYFQNNWLWSEVSLHYWGGASAATTWPGKAMELCGNDGTYDIYKLEVPKDITGIVINGIKDDGSNALDQTPDIKSGWYDGICYYMKWSDGNTTGSEDINEILPMECDHSYTSAITTAATCTKPGVKTFTCSKCGDSYTESIAATGHSYTSKVTAPTCEDDGYTTYTCACGDSYVADYVDALGHSYDKGICGTCGAKDPNYNPVVIPTISLQYPTLALEDTIKMNVYFTIDNQTSVVEMGMLTWTAKPAIANIDTAESIIPGAAFNSNLGFYGAGTNGIPAQNLGDEIFFCIYAKLSDGSYAYSKQVSYSPTTYAYNQLGKNSTSAAAKALYVSILNYGAAAQTYLNYKADALINAKLTDDQKALVKDYSADMVHDVAAPDAVKAGEFIRNKEAYPIRQPNIALDAAFAINYYFTPGYEVVGEMTFYYWNAADFDAADVLTTENATGEIVMTEKAGVYGATISGIAAKDVDSALYACGVYTAADGNTYCTGILPYSLGAYCGSQASKGGATAPLAAAIAVYGYYAAEFFAQ